MSSHSPVPFRTRLVALIGVLGMLAPLVGAIVFVKSYASGFPLTDEWSFVHAIVDLQGADLGTWSGIRETFEAIPKQFNDHCVLVPFLFYWPMSEWLHFDDRWAIYVTVAAFAIQALLFRAYVVRSTWWTMPIALVLLCPSHYMEFMWGWQFTLALSVVFPVGGLVVLDRALEAEQRARRRAMYGAALALLLLGTFSSAGGFFGFVGAVVLCALKPVPRRTRIVLCTALTAFAAYVYFAYLRVGDRDVTIGVRNVLHVATALGGTIWSTPVGMSEFELDLASATGFLVMGATAFVLVRAFRADVMSQLALAASIAVFGYLCVAAISLTRPYLGNWHLQYGLPAICGSYALAYLAWRSRPTRASAIVAYGGYAVLALCLVGWYRGFAQHGPDYESYVRRVENYTRANLFVRGLERPYPFQGDLDADGRLMMFLSAHEHPVYERVPGPRSTAVLPESARVYVDGVLTTGAVELTGGWRAITTLAVVVPDAPKSRLIQARIGERTLVLRKVRRLYLPRGCGVPAPNETAFLGVFVPRLYPETPQAIAWTLHE